MSPDQCRSHRRCQQVRSSRTFSPSVCAIKNRSRSDQQRLSPIRKIRNVSGESRQHLLEAIERKQSDRIVNRLVFQRGTAVNCLLPASSWTDAAIQSPGECCNSRLRLARELRSHACRQRLHRCCTSFRQTLRRRASRLSACRQAHPTSVSIADSPCSG